MQSQKGFSLIELMVVVAIIGILAAIVLPAYSNYVIRGKIPDATSNLSSKRVAMEQYYQDHKNYVGGPACVTDTTSSKYYTFSCSTSDAYLTTYVITAAGPNSDTSMNGFTYAVDQSNNKASSIATPANSGWIAAQPAGWTAGTAIPSGGCWITKPGGVC